MLTKDEKRERYNARQRRAASRRGQPSVSVGRRRKLKIVRRKGGEVERAKIRQSHVAAYRPLFGDEGFLPPESNLLSGLFAALLRVRRRR